MKLNTVLFIATVLWSSATSAVPVPSAQHDHSFRNGVAQFVQDINEGESFREALGITPHRRDVEYLALEKRAIGATLGKLFSGFTSRFGSKAASSVGKSALTTSATKVTTKPGMFAGFTSGMKSLGTKIKGVFTGKKGPTPLKSSTASSKSSSGIKALDTSAKSVPQKLDTGASKGLQRSKSLDSGIKKTESVISPPSMKQSTGGSTLNRQSTNSVGAAAADANMQPPKAPSMMRSLGETFISAAVSATAMTAVGVIAQKAMSGGGGEGGAGGAQGGEAGAMELFVDDAGNLVDGQRNILMAAGTWTQDENGEIVEVKKGSTAPAAKEANTSATTAPKQETEPKAAAAKAETPAQGQEAGDAELFTDEAGNLVDGQGKILMAAGTWTQNENGEVVKT